MSGFEVIGSIRATFTLVVNLLHSYKDSEISQDWDLLLECFKTEELIYLECIQHLIAANVSEADLQLFSSRKDATEFLWKDKTLQSAIAKSLGQEKTSTLLLTLLNIDKLMKTLHEGLPAHGTTSVSLHAYQQHGIYAAADMYCSRTKALDYVMLTNKW
jgi:hypothetical protein